MNKKVAAVVVLYNPDKNYIKNINTYLYHVSLLVIVDNSEIPDYSVYSSLENINHIKFVINKENTGISKAINDGIKIAVKEGFEWVLTMDQDSFFENNMIEILYLKGYFTAGQPAGNRVFCGNYPVNRINNLRDSYLPFLEVNI